MKPLEVKVTRSYDGASAFTYSWRAGRFSGTAGSAHECLTAAHSQFAAKLTAAADKLRAEASRLDNAASLATAMLPFLDDDEIPL